MKHHGAERRERACLREGGMAVVGRRGVELVRRDRRGRRHLSRIEPEETQRDVTPKPGQETELD